MPSVTWAPSLQGMGFVRFTRTLHKAARANDVSGRARSRGEEEHEAARVCDGVLDRKRARRKDTSEWDGQGYVSETPSRMESMR